MPDTPPKTAPVVTNAVVVVAPLSTQRAKASSTTRAFWYGVIFLVGVILVAFAAVYTLWRNPIYRQLYFMAYPIPKVV